MAKKSQQSMVPMEPDAFGDPVRLDNGSVAFPGLDGPVRPADRDFTRPFRKDGGDHEPDRMGKAKI